ncbi:unnamed protein product [Urochloa decumbens]|uniref:DUF7378 domain-containing protein n=1 Tax=Urochloa decumbens TaxID=240449 RepID=A0ABC8W9Y5_9POAL
MAVWRSSSSKTVGQVNTEAGLSRSNLWAEAVLWPLIFFVAAMVLAFVVYRVDTDQIAREPWRLLVVVAWLPYVMLGLAIMSYMNLSLPLTPVATQDALFVATLAGFLILITTSCPVLIYGHTHVLIAFGCTVGLALAGLLALWLWLHRTYRAVDYQLPT